MRRIRHDEADATGGGFALYRGEPYTGEIAEVLDSGEMVALSTYAQGVEDGPWQRWYPDGTKRVEGRYRDGAAVGVWREWHPSGVLAGETFYSPEGRKLTTRRWDESGALVEAVFGG
ncbi:toxin-antitoxin system YwqK family antitoxin [Streptomonospora litoralis]|uniref:Antitoxin YwqK n=1 Tax=Streptomonospora litoralis TaxID=2498135 RepID=A0A4V0ZJ47_9ACTN|nr:hypothetical protein [Streptomonospora litoralis]QBI52222.1 Putative antitoxin YwqK [Streptomonospora litoralis]